MKLHKPINVFLLSWFFGPLAGGLLVGLDYKRAGKREWIYILVIPTLLVFAFMGLLVYANLPLDLPSFILPAIYGGIYMYLQQKLVNEMNTSEFLPIMAGCAYSLAGLLGVVVLLLILFLPSVIEITNYVVSGQLTFTQAISLFFLGK